MVLPSDSEKCSCSPQVYLITARLGRMFQIVACRVTWKRRRKHHYIGQPTEPEPCQDLGFWFRFLVMLRQFYLLVDCKFFDFVMFVFCILWFLCFHWISLESTVWYRSSEVDRRAPQTIIRLAELSVEDSVIRGHLYQMVQNQSNRWTPHI